MRQPTSIFAAVMLGGLAVLASLAAADEPRTWSDDSGKFQIEATFLAKDQDVVVLKRTTGQEVRVPLARLSKADQEYLATRVNPAAPGPAPMTVPMGDSKPQGFVPVMVSDVPGVSAGLVIHRDAERAIIVIPSPQIPNPVRADPVQLAKVTCSVVVEGAPPRIIPATIIERHRDSKQWLLSVPAAEVPAPFSLVPPAILSEGGPVKLVVYDPNFETRPTTFKPRAIDATWGTISRLKSGEASVGLVKLDKKIEFRQALVLDTQGRPLAYIWSATQENHRTTPEGVPSVFLFSLAKLLDPRLEGFSVVPTTGDISTIDFSILASGHDPLNRLREPRLLVKTFFDRSEQHQEWPEPYKQRYDDAEAVPLKKEELSPEELGKFRYVEPAVQTWLAKIRVKNPGVRDNYGFALQIVYKHTDGSDRFLKPTNRSFSRSSYEFGPDKRTLPDIPGINGHPLDYPITKPHPKGGFTITSDLTRMPNPSPALTAGADWPKPRAMSQSAVDNTYTARAWQATELKLPKSDSSHPLRMLMRPVFSPTGDWLYISDERGYLHRIATKDLTETHTLEIGRCRDLVLTKAGLVACITDKRKVLVINPDTFQIVREIQVSLPYLLAGSPATSIGLVAASPTDRGGDDWTLYVYDFAKGIPLHTLKKIYSGRSSNWFIRAGGEDILSGHNFTDMAMTPDGRYVAIACGRLTRMRLEGEDLVFEQQAAKEARSDYDLKLWGKDNTFVMPSEYSEGNNALYALGNLAASKAPLQFRGAVLRGIDPVDGTIYCTQEDRVSLFDISGEKKGEFPLKDKDMYQMLVSPTGGKFLVWGRDKVTWCQRRPDDE